jgi:hypothetical protein
MSCLSAIKIIQPEQCIGNSLSIINENFIELRDTACDNLDRIVSLEQIETQLSNDVISLSSIVVPGVAKAWVKFDGTLTEANEVGRGFRKIYSKYNIDGVQPTTFTGGISVPGFYTIFFSDNLKFEKTNYLVLGTSSEAIVNSKYTWVQPIEYDNDQVTIKVTNTDGLGVDAKHISVVIF